MPAGHAAQLPADDPLQLLRYWPVAHAADGQAVHARAPGGSKAKHQRAGQRRSGASLWCIVAKNSMGDSKEICILRRYFSASALLSEIRPHTPCRLPCLLRCCRCPWDMSCSSRPTPRRSRSGTGQRRRMLRSRRHRRLCKGKAFISARNSMLCQP